MPRAVPPRLPACGRDYVRAGTPAIEHPTAAEVAVRVASALPSRTPVLAPMGCSRTVPTVVYLPSGDGYVSYGLSGSP